MDSTTTGSWSTSRSGRPSTPTSANNITARRNTDRERELQQLKSRGVVSVLNKTFDSHDNYVLAPASPPNPSHSPSSANSQSNRTWRKSTSSGTTDLQLDGITQISTKQHMLYDDAPMASPSDITNSTKSPLRKAQSQDHWAGINARMIFKDSGAIIDTEQDDAALFHVDNHSSLINQYKHMIQHTRQMEDQLLSCQVEQQQMENSTRQILENSLKQQEDEACKIRQLSAMVLKQDQVIHELEQALSSVLADNERLHQQTNGKGNKGNNLDIGNDDTDSNQATQDEILDMRRELEELRNNRTGYEIQIMSLCNALESNQEETNRLTLMLEKVNQECHQQQVEIDEKVEKMILQLANKDDLIRKYRDRRFTTDIQQEHQHNSQLTDRSSLMPSATISMDSNRSRSGVGAATIPPPTGPPPSSPLPALPSNCTCNGGISIHTDPARGGRTEHHHQQQQQQQKEQHDLTSDDELDDHVLTPSMEMLLLQTPSTYCLDESVIMMDEAHREYTEQLQNRLSISKEIDHLEVWDHAALERLQRKHLQQTKRTSLAPTTTTTASSSKWSDRSSSAFESDWDDKQGHSTFWKGMKKKLRV